MVVVVVVVRVAVRVEERKQVRSSEKQVAATFQHSELSLEVVRASVELLIQHNCVYCVERRVARTTNQQSEALSASAKGKSAATSSSIVTYAYACSAQVCQRLSYPAFLTTKWGRSSTHPHRTRKAVIRPTRDQGGGRAATNCGERTAVQPHGRRTLRVPCDGGGALLERAPGRGTPAADMLKREPKSGSGGGPAVGLEDLCRGASPDI